MSTAVGTDLELIQALDFEESKACESRMGPCPKVAAFLCVHVCCGATMLLCAPHVKVTVDWLTMHQVIGVAIDCLRCGKTDVPFPRIIPLGGGS